LNTLFYLILILKILIPMDNSVRLSHTKVPEEYQFNFEGFNYYCTIQKSEFKKCNPIVVLGGAFQNMQSWSKHLEYYVQLADVVLVDLPGTGKSDILPHEYSIEFLASTLHHLLLKLKIDKIEMVCASYGTPIGIIFASTFREMVSKLILIGTMKAFPPHRRKQVEYSFETLSSNNMSTFSNDILEILMNRDRIDSIRRYAAVHKVLSKIVKNTNQDGKCKYVENSKRLLNYTPGENIFSFDAPTLIFTGEHDSFTRPEFCREIASTLKNATFTTIQESDHLCSNEQFAITNKLIAAFLLNNDLNAIEGINKVEIFSSN